MQLNPQFMSEIYATLQRAASKGGSEARRATRLDVEAPITLWTIINGHASQPRTVLSRDISMNGIGLMIASPLAPGEEFLIQLPRGKREPLLMICKVQHIHQPADGIFYLGAQFVRSIEKSTTTSHSDPHAKIAIPAAATTSAPA